MCATCAAHSLLRWVSKIRAEELKRTAEFEETEKSDSTNSACSALDTVNVAYFVNFSRFYTIEDLK